MIEIDENVRRVFPGVKMGILMMKGVCGARPFEGPGD